LRRKSAGVTFHAGMATEKFHRVVMPTGSRVI
jgi:hypothetical protein